MFFTTYYGGVFKEKLLQKSKQGQLSSHRDKIAKQKHITRRNKR